MKEIKLGNTGYIALVDDEDYDFITQWNWTVRKTKNVLYATRGLGKTKTHKKLSWIMHRVLLNASPDKQVDHIDHNGLNNQKSNLRLCTHQQNHFNLLGRGISPYLGVSLTSKKNKWRAYIFIKGKIIHLGHFNTEEEAARAYDKIAFKTRGEFANLNFK